MADPREQKNVRPDMAALPEDSAFYKKTEPKTEKQKLSEMNWKQKVGYLVEYYGRVALVAVVLVAAVVSILYHVVFNKDIVLEVMAVNTTIVGDSPADSEEYYAPVLTACGINPESVSVSITSSIRLSPNANDSGSVTNMQAVQSRFMTCSVDVFFSDDDFFSTMAEFENFEDMRKYFTEEQLAGLGDSLIYTKNGETGEEYPVGVSLKDNEWIAETGWYSGDVTVGIPAGAKHSDTAVALVSQILGWK